MPRYHAHAFVDGGYLQGVARELKRPWYNPRALCERVTYDSDIQRWGERDSFGGTSIGLTRVNYYDCAPLEGEPDPDDMKGYCRAIELLPDTELGFGLLRGKPRRQKRVDTQMAVDMVVGAFNGTFSVAIVISGDEDQVPAIQEVRRRGGMVVVAGWNEVRGLSPELVRAADRFVDFGRYGRDVAIMDHEGIGWPNRNRGVE